MEHESCFRNKSGGVLDCVISMVELPLENGMHVLTMARDITEQKRVEAELREKRARLELALRSASMGVWERDLKTEKLYWSPELEQMMGFEPGTFPGTEEAYSGLLHPDSLGVYQEAKRRIREQRGSVYQEELRFRLSGGRELWGLVMGKVVQDAQGEPQRLVGILMDLTQRKRLEDQLRHALKLEAIGQLAGGVAHDFNNILAATMMNLSFLLQNPTLDPEIKEVLRELQAEARRAASLTRQLLMFSRRSVLEVKLLDFNEVVANVLKMLGRVIGEQVRIRFHPASVLPLVEADAGMMEQVLMNLSVNARDAMPQGGELTIST